MRSTLLEVWQKLKLIKVPTPSICNSNQLVSLEEQVQKLMLEENLVPEPAALNGKVQMNTIT